MGTIFTHFHSKNLPWILMGKIQCVGMNVLVYNVPHNVEKVWDGVKFWFLRKSISYELCQIIKFVSAF